MSEAIRRHDAIFGGEPCGAWVHPRYCPDGLLSALLFLKALELEERTAGEFVAEVPEYVTLRGNIACKKDLKWGIIANIGKTAKSSFPACTGFSTVDGVRMAFENGWILVRASGTEPLIRLTVEGESLKVASGILAQGKALVEKLIGDSRK